jgi:cell division protein FtsI/penicillin-binding protein 2
MLGDVEDPEGSGKAAFVPGMRVCGKTGTAQQGESKAKFELITWFASYAPYENPRYVVVVMVESGPAGGRTCAPVAGKIYKTIYDLESSGARPRPALVAEAR